MKLVKNIFTVSFFAIMVVVGARAEIVSKTNIVAGDNVTISNPAAGEPNAGKIVINATDTKYTLPDATPDTKGGVRVVTSTGESEIPSGGAMVPTVAAAAAMAAEIANGAIDENAVIKQQGTSYGDRILTTNPAGEVAPVDVTDNETGYVVTGVDVKEGEFILNRGNVQVPVGSATATTYAPIWIE